MGDTHIERATGSHTHNFTFSEQGKQAKKESEKREEEEEERGNGRT
jgi:hypothetical protein